MLIEMPNESAIMTYGTTKDPRRFWILGLFVLIGIVAILAIVFAIGLRKPINIPSHAAALFSVTPATAHNVLQETTRLQLPTLWQSALQGSSWWPVVLGAIHTDHGWRTFVIVPRWRRAFLKSVASEPEQYSVQSYGLMSLVKQRDIDDGVTPVHYAQLVHWWINRGWMSFTVHATAMFDETMSPEWNLGDIHGYADKTGVHTDLSFQQKGKAQKLQSGDLSLSFVQATSSPLLELVRTRLALGDAPQVFGDLPLRQMDVLLDEAGNATSTSLVFGQPVTDLQAKQILASFGVTSGQTVTLPDSSLMTEHILLQPKAGESLYTTYPSTRFGTIVIDPQHVAWGATLPPLVDAPTICRGAHPIARLSAHALSQFLRTIDVPVTPASVPSIQLLEDKGKMIVCAE